MNKQGVMLIMLDEGPILVQLDARKSGVIVPEEYANDWRLVLLVGYNLKPDVELEIEKHGFTATLLFGGKTQVCFVPWDAVWAMASAEDGQGVLWKENMPAEALGEQTPTKPKLTVMKGGVN
jgi:stringent starvation protein B